MSIRLSEKRRDLCLKSEIAYSRQSCSSTLRSLVRAEGVHPQWEAWPSCQWLTSGKRGPPASEWPSTSNLPVVWEFPGQGSVLSPQHSRETDLPPFSPSPDTLLQRGAPWVLLLQGMISNDGARTKLWQKWLPLCCHSPSQNRETGTLQLWTSDTASNTGSSEGCGFPLPLGFSIRLSSLTCSTYLMSTVPKEEGFSLSPTGRSKLSKKEKLVVWGIPAWMHGLYWVASQVHGAGWKMELSTVVLTLWVCRMAKWNHLQSRGQSSHCFSTIGLGHTIPNGFSLHLRKHIHTWYSPSTVHIAQLYIYS